MELELGDKLLGIRVRGRCLVLELGYKSLRIRGRG